MRPSRSSPRCRRGRWRWGGCRSRCRSGCRSGCRRRSGCRSRSGCRCRGGCRSRRRRRRRSRSRSRSRSRIGRYGRRRCRRGSLRRRRGGDGSGSRRDNRRRSGSRSTPWCRHRRDGRRGRRIPRYGHRHRNHRVDRQAAGGRCAEVRRGRIQLDRCLDGAPGHGTDRCRIRCLIRIGLVRGRSERPHGREHCGESGGRCNPHRPSSSTGRMGLAAQQSPPADAPRCRRRIIRSSDGRRRWGPRHRGGRRGPRQRRCRQRIRHRRRSRRSGRR